MKQFGKILKFEFMGYLKNKTFIGVTLFLVIAIFLCMFIYNIAANVHSDAGSDDSSSIMVLYSDESGLAQSVQPYFEAAFPDYQVKIADGTADDVKESVTSGTAECAFLLDSVSSYTYYVSNLSLHDYNTDIADSVLQEVYRASAMIQSGLTPEQASEILSVQIQSETSVLGQDQMQNFFYTYIMIFALYMVIILYGQMVANNVASEKSSRAMELLITSAEPTSMMFGKVLASCLAAVLQLTVVFGSALLVYNINKDAWGDNTIIRSLFNIPIGTLAYMLIFSVLGFLIYAFMYGAIGSTVSRLEDISQAVSPISFLFMAAFFVVVFSLSGGSIDSVLMKVCSYIPFTSPMAMFTRICMSTVPAYEIVISIVILAASAVGIGWLAAKIYRVGVLLYGTPLKLPAIIKAVFN